MRILKMNISIKKAASLEQIEQVFEDDKPNKHKINFINSRLQSEHAFIALDGKNPVGFLLYDIWWGDTPFIDLLKVKKDYLRHGIGSTLIKKSTGIIKSMGFEKLISSSQVNNNMGKSFHLKMGFSKLNILDLPMGKEQYFSLDL